MTKKRRRQLTDDEKYRIGTLAREYWEQLKLEVTGSALFVDTSALIDCFDPKYQGRMLDFLDREAKTYKLFTSTYVVTELVRRLIAKVAQYRFVGPNGEQYVPLAIHAFKEFMQVHKIHTVCVPKEVFELGKANLETNRNRENLEGWSLTDAISYEIVHGLHHNQILSRDKGFRVFGLMLLPH